MAVTLETELQSLMFSSQIPDIVIGTSDDNEVEVCLDCRDHTIFSALHFPYGRSVKIHDLRSVIEYYLRDRDISLDEFALRVKHNGATQTLATFKVLYLEQHFTGDISEFLRNNFLTTMAGKLTSPMATEFLHFFIAAGSQETVRYQVVASVDGIDGGEPRALLYGSSLCAKAFAPVKWKGHSHHTAAGLWLVSLSLFAPVAAHAYCLSCEDREVFVATLLTQCLSPHPQPPMWVAFRTGSACRR